jgi:hypothetical protein
MLESSPVGKVCSLATTAEDMERNLGDILAKAVDTVKIEKEPTMDFVESMEALPPLETVLGDIVEQLKRDKSGIFEENEGQFPSGRGTNGGDGENLENEDDVDLIDRIAAELLNN